MTTDTDKDYEETWVPARIRCGGCARIVDDLHAYADVDQDTMDVALEASSAGHDEGCPCAHDVTLVDRPVQSNATCEVCEEHDGEQCPVCRTTLCASCAATPEHKGLHGISA